MFWMSLIPALHALAAVLWIGGIFLAFMVLRPSVAVLEPAQRVKLWEQVFSRFFRWVWIFIAVILLTGYGEIFVALGSMKAAPPYVHLMQAVGLFMVVLFAWMYFMPFKLFRRAAAAGQTETALKIINTNMRPVIAINLLLGICEVVIGVAGPYLS
ncbi:MAG: CopD family protein [Pseudomonadota bacterium]|nr:CopD family protein [Pseudomonadota bacterium]